MKLCIKVVMEDTSEIKLFQTSRNGFVVKYEKHVKKGLTYVEAASELGCCIMHALACNGKLDNS